MVYLPIQSIKVFNKLPPLIYLFAVAKYTNNVPQILTRIALTLAVGEIYLLSQRKTEEIWAKINKQTIKKI
jgi:hypothetical protein